MSSTDQEERAQAAIRDIKDGSSVRGACAKWQVSRSYVVRRLEGTLTRKEANKTFQVLSPDQESQLASWAIGQARLGISLPILKFNDMAQRMLMASGTDHQLGQSWHRRFFARNPDILSTRSQAVKYIRANGVTDANIRIFFDRLNAPEIRDIPRERYYTNNELGFCQDLGQDHHDADANARAIVEAAVKGTWITFFECVSGSGKMLSPLITFQGAQAQEWGSESRGMFEHWCFKYFPKDSMGDRIAVVWLQDVFIPHVRVEHGDEWVVLICDAHYYQGNDHFLWLCLTNKIWVVSYESNCSHVVEPMEIGVSSLLKNRLNQWDSETASQGQTPSIEDVLKAYKRARDEVFTTRNVKNGWKTAGIFPRDISKPLSSETTLKERLVVRRNVTSTAKQRARVSSPTTDLTKIPVVAACDSYDYKEVQQMIAQMYPSSTYAERIIAQKLVKVLNYHAARIADLRTQNRVLKAKLNGTPKKSRKAVKRSPTHGPIRTATVRGVKRQLRGRVIYENEALDEGVPDEGSSVDSETDEDSDEAEDCAAV